MSDNSGALNEGSDAVSPPLWRDRSFIGMTATQFLGAFNDNLFKQALLLLFVAVPVAGGTRDLQWLGTLVFSVPFILFSGYAGFLSDRSGKRTVIYLSKVAEIVIMAMGALLFVLCARQGITPLLVALLSIVLFCMGSQSAFFGPGKYGILPELFRERDLPQANGIILMTTFLAIIFGSALAGLFFPNLLWALGVFCILVAIAGTGTSLLVRPVPPSAPGLKFEATTLWISRETRKMLREDRPLLNALLASSVFWLAAAMVQMAVIALGKLQLQENEFWTSLLTAAVSIGIAIGSVIAGAASKNRFNTRVLKTGLWGLVVFLLLMAPQGWDGRPHLLGYWGSLVALILLGMFTGMFAVPLQVFLQSRPPAGEKGRMIATMNLCNWIGITMSAGLYWASGRILVLFAWPSSYTFAFTASLLLVVAVLYRPKDTPLMDGAA
ncbi:MAG: MFS transporter [Planctomycetaceae bacterium]|nr:MFS transporter [Planctomycetales bacterium]MCB9873474.1 MFS transporter [Planctomycetaceae bacterium]MCB9940384.1 MFS transporter [Planctomycetaceae bacterium]HRX77852.1 MFS transporter [Pirellulaceae bacterium]